MRKENLRRGMGKLLASHQGDLKVSQGVSRPPPSCLERPQGHVTLSYLTFRQHYRYMTQAQLELAVEFERNASIHSVKSQQATTELLQKMARKHGERWYRISIDMHSCGFSPEMWRDTEKKIPNTFLSLSSVINGRSSSLRKLIEICGPDRILVESDYNRVECCTEKTVEMVYLVADVKGWAVEKEWVESLSDEERGAVRRLEDNWKRFRRGRHKVPESKGRRTRKLLETDSEGEPDA
ncbi:hypothetical protein FA15DRAFT_697207 [Coprinopsis marcescibilis]|uniref:Uncharacterized protein n=1 Tax=Coprinopsis marcescibilis TaxID=230819 RepID=A0A5C3KII8_COPMA|nr:hypothetical protein FA15DRAFT_697207 [Coprinopsis marcescibilis]